MPVVPISTAKIVVSFAVLAITTLLKNIAVVYQLEASVLLSCGYKTFIRNLSPDLFRSLIRHGRERVARLTSPEAHYIH